MLAFARRDSVQAWKKTRFETAGMGVWRIIRAAKRLLKIF
jgi:hypothetical protein